MKKHALALAVLIAPVAALANPTLYGKFNVTLDQVENDTGVAATSTDIFSVNSNSSRIGIKGDAETSVSGLKALYFAEFGVDVDEGNPVFSQRNIYAGLKGGFGTVRIGRIDTPLKDAQGKVDQFNDLAADIQNFVGGETRANNAIHYTSPKIADGLTFNLAVYPAEGIDIDNADADATTSTGVENGLADTLSASVAWEKDGLYAALAADRNGSGARTLDGFTDIDSVTAGSQTVADLLRAVVTYKADAFEVGALYQTADDVSAASRRADAGWLLGGAYLAGDWKFKAQYGVNEGDVTGRERTLAALGADRKLGKNTTLFGYYATVETDSPAPAADTAITTVAIGIDQRF